MKTTTRPTFTRRSAFGVFLFTVALPLTAFRSLAGRFAPEPELIEGYEPKSNGTPTAPPDLKPWQDFLDRFVTTHLDGINRVRYQQAHSEGAINLVQTYLDQVAKIDPTALTRDHARAFWINIYNAATIRLILMHYPVASIQDIDFGLFQPAQWDQENIAIAGKNLSLNQVEHGILRPIWRDPRLHYAVNCASIGCPHLLAQAFTAENSESLLDQGAKDYINHPRGLWVLPDSQKLQVSSIYDWFFDDFGGSEDTLRQHFRTYLDTTNHAWLNLPIQGTAYDWSLNGVDPTS